MSNGPGFFLFLLIIGAPAVMLVIDAYVNRARPGA
jgi:hypothetical protein